MVLSRRARCIEHAPVTARRVLDEPEVSRVFPSDVLGREELTAVLAGLSGELGGGLRMRQRSARRVVLRIVYSDRVTAEQQAVLMPPSNRDPEIFAAVRRVFDVLFVRRVRVRSLNLRARHLVHCPPELPLGDAVRRARWNTVLAAADAARRRFPQLNQAVRLAASLPSA